MIQADIESVGCNGVERLGGQVTGGRWSTNHVFLSWSAS